MAGTKKLLRLGRLGPALPVGCIELRPLSTQVLAFWHAVPERPDEKLFA